MPTHRTTTAAHPPGGRAGTETRTEAPAARVRALGTEVLSHLARLQTQGHPVLSVYLDLDPRRFPTPDTRVTELGSLLSDARRQGGSGEVDRVSAWLEADPTRTRGAHGLAIFSSEAAGIFEVVRVPSPVEPLSILDTIPWLEPLAAILSPGDWGVAVLSRRGARLLRGSSAGFAEFARFDGELHRRHAQGGWSQARYQRRIEEQVASHVREATARLLRAHHGRPFTHLVVVCSDELRPVVERNLHGDLAAVLSGMVAADLEHATTEEIVRVVVPLIERSDRTREHDLILRLEAALGTGGAGAAGLDDVLAALEQERVAALLVPETPTLTGGLCPECGRLSTDGDRACPLDGQRLNEVNATEYAIDEAVRQSAQIVVARFEPEWLGRHGDIAALLRW